MSSKRILITGGCGFIGANLVEYLLKNNDYQIRILDNLSVGRRAYIQEIVDSSSSEENLEPIELETYAKNELVSPRIASQFPNPQRNIIQLLVGDIRNKKLADLACQDIDTLVHLAAHTRVVESLENPQENFETNVIGTFNLLEASRKNGVKRFLFASSNAAVGEQIPPINEEMIPKPLSPYGASKLAGEAMCSGYFQSYGLKTVSLRFANAYGPYSEHKTSVIAEFCKRLRQGKPLIIYGDGTQTRDFIHTRDIYRAIYLAINALDQPAPHEPRLTNHEVAVSGEVFQIATEKETSILDLSRMMLRIFKGKDTNPKGRIVFKGGRTGEIRKNFSDITKAKERLGFHPEVDLEQGLEELLHQLPCPSIPNI